MMRREKNYSRKFEENRENSESAENTVDGISAIVEILNCEKGARRGGIQSGESRHQNYSQFRNRPWNLDVHQMAEKTGCADEQETRKQKILVDANQRKEQKSDSGEKKRNKRTGEMTPFCN
jgi:hypothetical protein